MPKKNLNNEIARVAYEIYVQSGYVQGHDLDHWLEAERIILSNHVPKLKKKDEVVKTLKTSLAKKISKATVKKTNTKKTPKSTGTKSVKNSNFTLKMD